VGRTSCLLTSLRFSRHRQQIGSKFTTSAFSGYVTNRFPLTASPNPSPIPGDPGNETTMNHVLDIFGVLPNRTIAEVMDPRESPFCYEYVEPY